MEQRSPGRGIFQLGFRQYLGRFWIFFALFIVIYAGLEVGRYALSRAADFPVVREIVLAGDFDQLTPLNEFLKLQPNERKLKRYVDKLSPELRQAAMSPDLDQKRAVELLIFLTIFQVLLPVIILFFMAWRVSADYPLVGANVFGQALVCGVITGVLMALSWSILHFIFNIMLHDYLGAFKDMSSFLWRTWRPMALIILFLLAIVFILSVVQKFSAPQPQKGDGQVPQEADRSVQGGNAGNDHKTVDSGGPSA